MLVEKNLPAPTARRDHSSSAVANRDDCYQRPGALRGRLPKHNEFCTRTTSEVVDVYTSEYPARSVHGGGRDGVIRLAGEALRLPQRSLQDTQLRRIQHAVILADAR